MVGYCAKTARPDGGAEGENRRSVLGYILWEYSVKGLEKCLRAFHLFFLQGQLKSTSGEFVFL